MCELSIKTLHNIPFCCFNHIFNLTKSKVHYFKDCQLSHLCIHRQSMFTYLHLYVDRLTQWKNRSLGLIFKQYN